VTESERFRAALEKIARLPAAKAAGEIARTALLEAELTSEENPEAIQVLIQKLKRTIMTTTDKLLQWKPQQCSFDELLELRAAARLLRAEFAAQKLDHPHWLPKAESDLDNEIKVRAQTERLRQLGELKKERESLRVVEERKVGLDRQIATFEAALHQ
jgi:hypothetical protein